MTDTTPTSKPNILLLALTAFAFLMTGAFLALFLTQDNNSSLDSEQVHEIVAEALRTQAAVSNTGFQIYQSPANTDDIQSLVDQAVSTQVAALRPTATPIPPTPTRVPNADAAGDNAFRGPADAPVVMVEFSDYQCPYCLRFYEETLPQILQKYPNQVKFVYRDFVIFGEDSVRAAMATRCAGEQGKFWEMQAAIFDSRKASDAPPLSQETLVGYAGTLGLDTASFTECLSSGRYSDAVTNDYQAAVNYGFTGTPGFLINGRVVMGAQPFQVFDQVIQQELAAAQQ
jgi:protein-disulfide isomerase